MKSYDSTKLGNLERLLYKTPFFADPVAFIPSIKVIHS